MHFDAVGIDTPCVDLAANVDTYPGSNETELVNEVSWQGGGKVGTGLAAAARLGIHGAVLGSVGDDSYGRFCDEDFRRHGLNTDGLKLRAGRTTNFDIIVSNKETMERAILVHRGTAEAYREEEIPAGFLTSTDYFYLSKVTDTTRSAARTAKKAGAKIFIDADSYAPELAEMIPEIDVFVGSEFVYDALFAAPEAGQKAEPDTGVWQKAAEASQKAPKDSASRQKFCERIAAQGPQIVIFTFGEKGLCGVGPEGYFEVPAYHVQVVDTVGAGDVFHGAFLAGLVKGYPVKEAARFASAVSAVKCTRIGGRAGIPDTETALHFMKTGEIDYTEIDRRVALYRKGL